MSEPDSEALQVTIASPKGGTGKTMTTILLAGEFAAAGHKVLVVDTDPQESASRWYRNSKKVGFALRDIDLVSVTDVTALGETLKNARHYSLILVDIQGTASAAMGAAVAYADFVVIPTRPHVFDVDSSLALIRQIELLGGRHRTIPYGVLLNGVSGIDKNTMAFRTALAQLTKAEVQLFDSFLSQRPTFGAIATAGTLYEVDGETRPIKDARDQTNAVAAEIINRLGSAR